ncbi:unnamed protein product [Fusarium graminearum]|nr:unnamed protein product [Fusarium graminearum]
MRGRDIRVKTVRYPVSKHLRASYDQKKEWCNIRQRNFCAVKSALLRGDTSVTLLNWHDVPDYMWNHLTQADEEIDTLLIDAFALTPKPAHDPDPSGNLQADARKDIESRKWYGLKFNFVKVLAKGGQGYVSLWHVTFDDGSTKKVVIKKGLSPSFDPEKEATFHLRYKDAEHTTQVIDLNQYSKDIQEELLKKDPACRPRFMKGYPWDAKRLGCAVFEYVAYGDVWKYMESIVPGKKKKFPNQVLWGIMECFALALATVSYTPSFDGDNTFEKEYRRAEELDKVEDLLGHGKRAWYSEHDVHQDLEALNVLMGEDPAHGNQPIFKLHDLGAFSECMRREWRTVTEFKIWERRHYPKDHAVTPEQISKEWDSLPIRCEKPEIQKMFCGSDFRRGTKCAGRYGTWTNVFLIARVMESMITREIMRYPFRPLTHIRADGSTGPQTYGWVLQDQMHAWVDPELRDLLCMCLYENPADRPKPLEILMIVKKWKDSKDHDPTEVSKWWEDVRGPRPVMPYKPQKPTPNSNAMQQAAIDGIGFLALHSATKPNPKNQAPVVDQPAQSAKPASDAQPAADQGRPAPKLNAVQKAAMDGLGFLAQNSIKNPNPKDPQPVPPPQPQQTKRPANPRVPAKVATARDKRILSQPRTQHGQVRLQKRPRLEVGPGEAIDIDREEAAYRCSGNSGNDAAPVAQPVQPGRPSDNFVMSINRATQNPARRVRFDDPLKPSKTSKVQKKLLSSSTRKVKRVPGPKKSQALEALVQGDTSNLPVAVQNIMSRVKHLEARLKIDAIPIYAYLK